MKNGIVWSVICCFIWEFPLASYAQVGTSPSVFPKNVNEAIREKSKDTPIEYVTLTCPTDGRQFQIGVTDVEEELNNGTQQVVCPYDGTVFFPSLSKSALPRKEALTLVTVRCPLDGREFKAEVDVEDLLAGRSGASLRCPYDGTKFRLSVLGTPEGMTPTSDDLTTLKNPTDAKPFRAFLKGGSVQELFSPFDGSPLSSQSATSQPPVGGVGNIPLERPLMLSRIEEVFDKGISQGVPKDIRQFGYDIFPEYIQGMERRNALSESSSSQNGSGTSEMIHRFEGLFGSGSQNLKELGGTGVQNLSAETGTLSTIPIGPEYVIGPGDTLILNIWGSVQQSVPVTVDADGKIMLPKAGPVYVWGLAFSEAETLIKKTLQEYYANFNISISMGRLRTIRIFVFGEVKVPGTYYLSPQATVLHALYAAYGPTKVGTMRRIKLLRADKTEEEVDLYEILIKGNNKQDLPLKANDTLLVSPIGDTVGIAGRVKRPAIYETVGPTTLTQLIAMAGGLSAVGYLQRIQIERIKDHERKIMQDFEFTLPEDLQKRGASVILQDGDLVTIFPIAAQRHNFVSILGSVERPGDYELKEGMRLRDFLEKAGGALPGTYMERAEVARYQTDKEREIFSVNLWKLLSGDASLDLPLKEWDVVTIYSKSQVIPPRFVEIVGAVHEPGTYELTEGMRVSDLVFRAGGVQRTASLEQAELFRLSPNESGKIIPVDLREILKEGKSAEKDFYLSEGDRLFIREPIADIQMGTVTLGGEFKYPGQYAVRRGETLSSVIRRAGGFTDHAFLNGAIFTRKALRDEQQERVKQFLETEQMALLQEQASLGVGYDSTQKQTRMGLLDYREKLLTSIGKSQFLGRMIVKLAEPDGLSNTSGDVSLEDGDSLTVPRLPSSVLVVGNVYNPVAVTYQEGKNADYYLRKVGGLTKSADKKRVYVIKANGEAVSQFARVKRVERGDTIVVPEEFRYRTPTGLFIKDTVNFLYQIAFGAIAIAAVK